MAMKKTPATAAQPAFELRPPSPLLLMLEAPRMPWEYASLLATSPLLKRAVAGDGHPVVVFPPLGASDITTAPMRQFLRARGYTPYAWSQGFNFGPRAGVLEGCRELVAAAHRRHGTPVSLVGWSLGGLYAREIAKEMPEAVRCVVTLATPFTGHPRANHAWRFYEWVSGRRVDDDALLTELRRPPACPTTSIYSKTDGIVAWPCSINEPAPRTENIEVHASHLGMGLNPLALFALADRLAQQPAQWRPFDASSGLRPWFYKRSQPPRPRATKGRAARIVR